MEVSEQGGVSVTSGSAEEEAPQKVKHLSAPVYQSLLMCLFSYEEQDRSLGSKTSTKPECQSVG